MGVPGTITAIRVKNIQQQPSHKLLWGSGLIYGITFYRSEKQSILPLSALLSSQIVLHCT